ncbi:MAG: hypothetical protein MJZ05_10535 [Fibrobacter sp.]|nr:hypothetical protein [Fibrobacter sp.]
MNKMKLSAIVLGLAAAGAFAQNAPAAAPAAAPAQPAAEVNADSVKAAEEAKAAEIKKAEEEKAAAEAKKAEEEKAAAEAKKAEEEKAAAEAKKAEEEKAAAEAKKAEEAKSAEAAPAAENTNPGEVSAAASSALSTIAASLSEGVSVANVQIKVSGTVDLEVVTNDVTEDGDLEHYNTTTDADFNVAVQFNDKWSASLDLAFGDGGNGYDGAYIQYKPADVFAVKVGDLTFSEGAFKSYYGYDDPANNAAGMKETTIRGFEIDLAGLELGLGFMNNEVDAYDLHVAYEFNYAGQHLRPYFNYLSHQDNSYNTLHAGIDAGLTLGGFSFRAVYGLHMDYLIDSDDKDDAGVRYTNSKGKDVTPDLTSMIHTFLIEPSFEVSMFEIKTAAFLALVFEGDNKNVEGAAGLDSYGEEVPEWLFIYAEPAIKLAGFMKLGIPVEFHTNSLNSDAELSTLDVGARVYINPVEHIDFTVFGMIDLGLGDDTEDDFGLRFGAEAVYSF